jgi:hypothetical protein
MVDGDSVSVVSVVVISIRDRACRRRVDSVIVGRTPVGS